MSGDRGILPGGWRREFAGKFAGEPQALFGLGDPGGVEFIPIVKGMEILGFPLPNLG